VEKISLKDLKKMYPFGERFSSKFFRHSRFIRSAEFPIPAMMSVLESAVSPVIVNPECFLSTTDGPDREF
jgi:hypothetical protein